MLTEVEMRYNLMQNLLTGTGKIQIFLEYLLTETVTTETLQEYLLSQTDLIGIEILQGMNEMENRKDNFLEYYFLHH